MGARQQVQGLPQQGPYIHDMSEDLGLYAAATPVQRWYALTLDITLGTPLNVLVHLPFTRYLARLDAYGHDLQHAVVSWLLVAIPLLVYFVAPTAIWGQTLGKRIVGIRVVGKGGDSRLSIASILVRESVGKLLSVGLFGVGVLMMLTRGDRRTLHDLLAGTRVISYRELEE